MNEKFIKMTTLPVENLMVRMALPTIVIMLISAMYNMADTYFVGTIGTTATAAVGVTFSLMALIQAIGFFFGQGAGNYISRELGAQRMENAARMAATGFILTISFGGLIALAGLLYIEPLALLLGSTPTILPHACEYLQYILLGAPWIAASFTLNTLLRFQGSAFYGMIGMTTGAILNVALDPLFIFVFDMGVSGAALATMISQFVSFCLLLGGTRRGSNIPVHVRNFAPSLHFLREIFRGGFPSLCRQGIASISVVLLNHVAGTFGDAAIASMSVVQRVMMVAGSATLGWGQGFQPVCGFNYGAGLYRRVKRAFSFCVKSAITVMVIVGTVGFLLAPDIIALFRRDDPEVIRIGSLALRMQCVTFPLMGWVIPNNMLLQNIGRSGRATILALARQGLFLLPFLFLLTPRLGILGIQMAQPFADIATFFLSVPLGVSVLRAIPNDDIPVQNPLLQDKPKFLRPELEEEAF